MGTDAHFMVEVRLDDGQWLPVISKIWPNHGWQDHGEEPLTITPVLPRDYGLYSILADVRNRTGRGPTYMKTIEVPGHEPVEYPYDTDDGGHDPLLPIAEPRGVPTDANVMWREFTAQEDVGFHDPSWLSLREIVTADWEQVLYEQAVVLEPEYLAWRDNGVMPTSHSRGIGGEGVITVNEVEYAAGKRGERETAVTFRWRQGPLRESVPGSFWLMVATMTMLAPDGDNDRVRLLMVFDS